jgi:hypothetical protein
MGAAPSRHHLTDWATATGGLSTPNDTVVGDPPTVNPTKITLAPKRAVMGQTLPVIGQLITTREYDVVDATGMLIFTTQAYSKLESGFDLFRADDDSNPILRIGSNASNRTWSAFTAEPNFEGQKPEPNASSKAGVDLYRKATIVFVKGSEHHALVHIFYSLGDDDVNTVLTVERCRGEGIVDTHWHFQTSLPLKEGEDAASQPLVGYWKWAGSNIPLMQDDKIEMELCKGSDLALHVILAIVSTIERASIKAEYSG